LLWFAIAVVVSTASVPAGQQEQIPVAPVEAPELKPQAAEPEASPLAAVDQVKGEVKAEIQEKAKSEDAGSRRRRRTKKIKYVEEDDVSEGEEAALADKKKRAQQLDYQLRTVRVASWLLQVEGLED
jgi:hypothetical protein